MDGIDNWIMGGVSAILGILGLFLAARASDVGIYAFGLLLFVFAVLFVFSRIKGAFDAAEARDLTETTRAT